MNKAAKFFYDNAGWCYDPRKDASEEAGHVHCAQALAAAEARAKDDGLVFGWMVDDEDSSSFSDDKPAWPLWVCIVFNAEEEPLGLAMGAIDFGRGGCPDQDPYRRVVEAELALDYCTEQDRAVDRARLAAMVHA